MTRKEFSDLLSNMRTLSGYNRQHFSFKLHIGLSSMRAVEQATRNYSVDIVFKYLKLLRYNMIFIDKSNNTTILSDSKQLIEFVKSLLINGIYTNLVVAERTGMCVGTIKKLRNQGFYLSIDSLLSIADLFEYEIKLIPTDTLTTPLTH